MHIRTKSFVAVWLFICVSIAAQAQVFRTYVSAAGNDANSNMACPQNAPCRNFNVALGVTSPHGEVVALDSGDYFPFNITQSVTIKAVPGADVTVTVGSFGDDITINAASSDTVVLRGLTISGGPSGWTAVHYFSGGTLQIENCVISDFETGIRIDTAGKITVTDTVFRNNLQGANMGTTSGQIHAIFDHVQIKNSSWDGLGVWDNTQVVFSNGFITDTAQNAIEISSSSTPAVLSIEGSVLKNNTNGIVAYNMSIVRVSHSTITDNGQALSPFGGQILSFGNNRLAGNVTDGAFTGMIALQ